MNIIGALTKRELPARTQPVRALILHTTGETDEAAVLRWYESADGLQPHYHIAIDGTIRRIAWETQVAWHCKIDPAEARLYQLGYQTWSQWTWLHDQPVHTGSEWAGYREWRDRWTTRGYHSPLDLVTGEHPNSVSVGIELQQPVSPGPDIFSDAQYAALAELVADVTQRQAIPADATHVIGHYDVSPMRRCNVNGNWDPGSRFNWNRLWDELRQPAPLVA